MTRFRSKFAGAISVLLLLLAVTGCRDELPTTVGPERFPDGTRPNTIILDLPVANFLEVLGQFGDYAGPHQVPYLLVANAFEGALTANALARLTGFPTAVTVPVDGTQQTDTVFTYQAGEVRMPVDTAASASAGPVRMQLWALAQEWEQNTASWTVAVDTGGVRTPWAQPGGTPARLLANADWTPGDTLVSWAVDSLSVQQMAQEGFPGVLVTAMGTPARLQLGRLSLQTGVRPAVRQDTVVAQTITAGPQTFVFTPEPAFVPGTLQAGGIRAARTLLRLTLPREVSTCPPVATGAGCAAIPLRDVTINQAALLLQPLPVGGGFRPLVPATVRLRTISEPELGRQAPLGLPVADLAVQPTLFAAPADTTVAVSLTDYLRSRVATEPGEAAITANLALLVEPVGGGFGLVRFSAAPRLRIVYTLPLQRTSP